MRRSSGITSPVSRHWIGSSTATLQVSLVRRIGGAAGTRPGMAAHRGRQRRVHALHRAHTADADAGQDGNGVPGPPLPPSTDAAEEEVQLQRSYVSTTIHGDHVLIDGAAWPAASANISCKMRGCDMPASLRSGHPPCECGFMICQECYVDCAAAAGNCPGCKEPYSAGSDTDDSVDEDDDEAVSSSEERDQMPMTSSFARTWVPFCRKHGIEPRCLVAYFGQKRDFLKNKVPLDFFRERMKVKREYDKFKVRVNSLPEVIRRRSDAYNAGEELCARRRQQKDAVTAGDATAGQLCPYPL